MKKIFYILLFIPLFGFSQTQVDCSLLTVTDVIFQNDSITFEIFNADTVDSHYPYVAFTLDANGDTHSKWTNELLHDFCWYQFILSLHP